MTSPAEKDYGKNAREPAIRILHSSLRRVGESAFRVKCPVCVHGILMVGRDQETLALARNDRCIVCAQMVCYLDEVIDGEELPS